MKKRDILISLAIIAMAVMILFYYLQGKGKIKIDAGGAAAKLHLSGGLFGQTTINSEAEFTKVNVQPHRPKRLILLMKQDGNTWQIDSRGPWGKLSTIRVNNNETTALKLGPPFLIKPRVKEINSRVLIDFAIIGQAGEQYQNVISKNNRSVSAPKVKITDEAGNVLASGRFEYG